ncbi:MAG: neutral zinc metallopeptidase [Acidobacteria bacterium]|nr:neutral zinc metallopeptidase [Acidobacteriota bacterium]
MRWTPGGSDDVEDRRGQGGGGGGLKLGLGGILVLGVLSLIFKTDLVSPFLGNVGGSGRAVSSGAPDEARKAREETISQFATAVFKDVQDTWARVLPEEGARYVRSKLVLFWDATESACGAAESATGPFYCPGDQKVYIDLGFYDELKQRFAAPGDFAQAYVLAHEVGHHVQDLLGTERKVRQLQKANPEQANELSVRMELQADCYAGVWGFHAGKNGMLDAGDVEEGLNAASAIGDDRIQKMAGRSVQPESFTHGSSAQRVGWFKRGFASGKVSDCNTFAR